MSLSTLKPALQLWNQLNLSGNACISPLSIQLAMAMVYLGADGETKKQISKVLEFPEDEKFITDIDRTLKTISGTIWGKSDTRYNVANRLFGRNTFTFKEPFLKLTAEKFKAELQSMDFTNQSATASAINKWVEEKTNSKIKDLITPDAITDATTLILVNALYLKAAWPEQFEESQTKSEPFTDEAGKVRLVPTMNKVETYGYAAINGSTYVSLPLEDGFAFNIIMPDAPNSSVTEKMLEKTNHLAFTSLSLHLPKFKIEGEAVKLGKAMQALGITEAFDVPPGSANFDTIATRKPDDYLALGDVVHKTFVDVNENGVEAAAATAAMMVRCTCYINEPEPIEVKINKPFYFTISHQDSKTCLFLGRVVAP